MTLLAGFVAVVKRVLKIIIVHAVFLARKVAAIRIMYSASGFIGDVFRSSKRDGWGFGDKHSYFRAAGKEEDNRGYDQTKQN